MRENSLNDQFAFVINKIVLIKKLTEIKGKY